ncbi:carboxypeptidase regulatory-like domain-containing protein [Calditrichota bacterium]
MNTGRKVWFWNLLLVMTLAIGLGLLSCAKKDDDNTNNGPNGPDDSGTVPADFAGTWYKLAVETEGSDGVELQIDPLVSIEVDSAGTWKWFSGASRIRNGSSTWDDAGDKPVWTMNQAVVGGEEQFRDWTVNSYDSDMAEMIYTTTDSTQVMMTWHLVRGTNKFIGLVNLNFDDSPLSGATVNLDNAVGEVGTSQTDEKGFFKFTELAPGTYSAMVSMTDYESIELDSINVNTNKPSIRGAAMVLDGGDIGTLMGVVTNSESGDPIYNAEVKTERGTATYTDSSGAYSLTVAAGARVITVYSAGFDVKNDTVVVAPASNTQHNVAIVWNPEGNKAHINGVVRDGEYQAPVNNVSIVSDDGFSTITNDNGEYTLDVYAGVRILTLTFARYDTVVDTTDYLRKNGDYQRDYLIWPYVSEDRGTVQGRVYDAGSGVGIFDATISSDLGVNTITSPDENGDFTLDCLIGQQTITARRTGYDPQSWPILVVADSTYSHNFALREEGSPTGGTVAGQVTNQGGNPIVGATVFSDDGIQTQTDANGNYTLMEVAEGDRLITASHANYQDREQTVTVVAGEIADNVNFTLPDQSGPTGTIHGTVTDETSGNPIQDARVQSDDGSAANADGSGNYSLTVEAGNRTITCMMTGYEAQQRTQSVQDGGNYTIDFALDQASGGGNVDTLIYDDRTNQFDDALLPTDGGTLGLRMTPTGACQVIGLQYVTFVQGAGNFNAQVLQWSNNSPGNVLDSQAAMGVNQSWVSVDISGNNVQVTGQFVVGFGSINSTCFIGWKGSPDTGRVWINSNSNPGWNSANGVWGMRAIVRYPDGTTQVLEPDINQEPVTLESGNHTTQINSTGLTGIGAGK